MAFKKIGRNESCPCGSGKKYKVCCQQQTQKTESHATEETTVSTTELFAQGLQHHKAGELAEAKVVYEKILHIDPANADALHHLGLILHYGGNNAQAIDLIQQAISISPNFAIYNNLANILKTEQKTAQAIEYYEKAISLKPDYADAYNNLGVVYKDQNNLAAAIANYQKAITFNPNFSGAYANLGTALKELHNLEAAIVCYRKAIAIQPNYADAYNGLASAFNKQHKLDDALENYQKAIELNPRSAETYTNLGHVLNKQQKLTAAIACYEKALTLKPNNAEALGSLFHLRQHCCDWTDFQHNQRKVMNAVNAGQEGYRPLSFLAVSDSGQAQKQCAFTFGKKNYPPAKQTQQKNYQHSKIRIAYISADLREHAVSILMAELFELHDKNRFEIFAISLQPETTTTLGQRVKNAFTHFIDATDKSDVEVAQLIEHLEIDIAVDLMGFTANSRTAIFAYRPAPIQINYLGYPGTMGVDYIDYIVADAYLIPPDLQKHYSEKIIYMPDCFQVNDSKRFVPTYMPTRAEVGLPETGFVFCAFNGSYKFTPDFFDVWMNILKAVPNSVLWLFADNLMVETNLRNEAIKRGVAVERLIFAKKVVYQSYLANYQLADLFLDTLPFNGGTTVSDALWMGLPVLTYSGEAFAARMAGSLLNALGLPELITSNLLDYANKAIQLATTLTLLAEIRAKLAEHKKTYPLFNPAIFCKHLESAYSTIWERHQRDEPPVTFNVENFSTPAFLLEKALNHHHAGQLAEAEKLYKQILKTEPNNSGVFHNLGLIAHQVGKKDIAEKLVKKAIEINPNNYVYHSSLGFFSRKRGELEEAIKNYQIALSLNPEDAEAYYNIGVAYEHQYKFEQAITNYQKAISINYEYANAHHNLGLLLLSSGQFEQGWQHNEYRYHSTRKSTSVVVPSLKFPQWQGEPLANKSILIWYEQGHGDQIQFCRYAPMLKEMGASIVNLVCEETLKLVFETLSGVNQVLARNKSNYLLVQQHDYWVFPLSIPLHCHTTVETIPCQSSYLSAVPEKIAEWKPKLPEAKFKVGLVWKGSTLHHNDANRSLASLRILSPLWDIAEVAFISLQKGQGEDEVVDFPFITSLSANIKDFADSAAIVSQLDLVICVDTAIAHLAGALGKPVWLLLPFVSDWRWMINREDSPWYPNTRLFRQAQKGNWNDVVIRLKQALINEVNRTDRETTN
jgi:predicted O-linked N-acetylglucosamine transferase (SPINDLY family)